MMIALPNDFGWAVTTEKRSCPARSLSLCRESIFALSLLRLFAFQNTVPSCRRIATVALGAHLIHRSTTYGFPAIGNLEPMGSRMQAFMNACVRESLGAWSHA